MPALLSYVLDIPFSVSLLVLGLLVLWFPRLFPRFNKKISFRIDSRRNGQRRVLLPQSSHQSCSSSRSVTSRTIDSGDASSQEDEEDSILEAVSTLFYEEEDWNNDEVSPRPPNSFVARILPLDRIIFQQSKPRQNNNAGELRQKLNEELFKGATCQPNRTSSCGISFYDYKTTSCDDDEDAEESRIVLEVDVTAQAPSSPVRYRIHMHLNRPAHESPTRTLKRLQISLKRKIIQQERLDNNNLRSEAFNPREKRFRKERKKRKEDSIPASLWVQDSETTDDVDGDSEEGYRRFMIEGLTNSSSLWQTLSKQTAGSRLRMNLSGTIGRENDVIIPVVACPPTLVSVKTFQDFGAKIFVGVPLVVEIEAIHTSELIVIWFVDDEEVHWGSLLYTPCAADVGKIISLLLVSWTRK
jgi:hypothetical protein